MACRSQWLLVFCFVTGYGFSSSSSYGFTLSGSVGAFDPHDGIVRGLYDAEPVYSLGLGLSQTPTLHWTFTGNWIALTTRVHDLQTSASLFLLNTGFRKYLPEAERSQAIAPFFGAGVSGIRVSEILKEEQKRPSSLEPAWTNGSFWEVGLLLPLSRFSDAWIEVFLWDQRIDQIVVGGLNLGGRLLAIGYQQRFE